MSSKGTYYQFNLDFNGRYIRGHFATTTDQDHFFTIKEPTYSDVSLSDKFKPINNQIRLLKNVVVCYFEINENQI